MDSKVNYTVVGIFVVILGIALFMVILWLSTLQHRQEYETYVTYMREEVSGLNVQAPVRFNGVKVGYVRSIELKKDDPQQVRIVMQIAKKTPITTSTVAVLMAEGITGIDYIGLKATTADAPFLRAKPGETFPVIPSEPSFLVKLSTALQEVTQSLKGVSVDIRKVFDEKNRKAVSDSLANINKVTKSFADNSRQIGESLKSANRLLYNAAQASEQLPHVMKYLNEALSSVKSATKSFHKTSQVATATIQSTGATVKNISQQLIPSAQTLLTRLNNVANNLQAVTNELKQNPSVLVRGKSPPSPGPGEK